MNDRFKFRTWDKKRKIMVCCVEESTPEQIDKFERIYYNDEYYYCREVVRLSCLYDIDDNFIVEQCTGLKDKNGKLIYENDIIDTPNGIYRVAVDDFGLWTAIYKGNPLKDVVEWSDIVKNYAFNKENVEIAILGNIHENKELLDE